MTERILGRFPEPPKDVLYIMLLLDQADSTDPEEQEQAEVGADDAYGCKVADLPRPWDPAELPPPIRQEYWLWLDDVALWVNHTYGWRLPSRCPRAGRGIPGWSPNSRRWPCLAGWRSAARHRCRQRSGINGRCRGLSTGSPSAWAPRARHSAPRAGTRHGQERVAPWPRPRPPVTVSNYSPRT